MAKPLIKRRGGKPVRVNSNVLARFVAKQVEVPIEGAEYYVNMVFDILANLLSNELEEGDKIHLRGIGTIEVMIAKDSVRKFVNHGVPVTCHTGGPRLKFTVAKALRRTMRARLSPITMRMHDE